ncbi:MAG: hypothetical protein GF364_08795 [Candidatus Lokiarchaeota archaeon]|nr:hypothetical protein [Candidatus Lokiarchaeota archaeon]
MPDSLTKSGTRRISTPRRSASTFASATIRSLVISVILSLRPTYIIQPFRLC